MVTYLRNKFKRVQTIARNFLGLSLDDSAAPAITASSMADDELNAAPAGTDSVPASAGADDAAQPSSERSSLKRASPHDGHDEPTAEKKPKTDDTAKHGHDDDDDDDSKEQWQTVSRSNKKKSKKLPRPGKNYPSITFSPGARLQSKIGVSHLRDLVTYIFADGAGPQWCAVMHRPAFRKIVAVMVPGLEEAMFRPGVDLTTFNETRDDDVTTTAAASQDTAARGAAAVCRHVSASVAGQDARRRPPRQDALPDGGVSQHARAQGEEAGRQARARALRVEE
ncbi:hypothetical protein BBAD15_g5790 [Beauveria bassiana D1-5]|uniref:Uncharacterized protein n=1 Tax=Beauveria bassiana D1-5 TaxID=1245745 RepID=A0A0A2VRT1_BEABA|nr:hypothetical protein BBAD15_g5790 [Beauveria bassiana D1-5]